MATGAGLNSAGYTLPPTAIAFRAGSKRVAVLLTNATFHNDYTFIFHNQADAISALIGKAIKVVSVNPGGGTEVNTMLVNYATSTGAVVDVSAFAPYGSTTQCLTGVNGEPRLPDSFGKCPLVFSVDSSGTGASVSIGEAIKLALQ